MLRGVHAQQENALDKNKACSSTYPFPRDGSLVLNGAFGNYWLTCSACNFVKVGATTQKTAKHVNSAAHKQNMRTTKALIVMSNNFKGHLKGWFTANPTFPGATLALDTNVARFECLRVPLWLLFLLLLPFCTHVESRKTLAAFCSS